MPIFLSDIPALFSTRPIPLDVALLQLSPPDRHGYCTLGTSVDAARAAVASRAARDRRDQRPDAAHARQHARSASTRRRLHPHRSRRSTSTRRRRRPPVEDAIGELVADARRRTARRCRWASARSQTPCSRASATSTISASTPRCSPTASSIWSRRASITNRAKTRPPRPHRHELRDRHARGSSTSSTTTRWSSSTPAIAPTTPRSSARTTTSSRSTRRSRST